MPYARPITRRRPKYVRRAYRRAGITSTAARRVITRSVNPLSRNRTIRRAFRVNQRG